MVETPGEQGSKVLSSGFRVDCLLQPLRRELNLEPRTTEPTNVMDIAKEVIILDLPSLPTISDGTAGGIEPGAVAFDLCREWVDDYVTVTEDEINEGLREFLQIQHMLIEGFAAVAIAAMVRSRHRLAGKNVVVIICGANIILETLKTIL
jgi:threonine dehydratase